MKRPHHVFDTVFAFSPNRETMGGTAYLLVEETGNILIDCPAWDESTHLFLQEQGGVKWLFLTHRGGIGNVRAIQQAFTSEIVIQEQEAYLLPNLSVTGFQHQWSPIPTIQAIWTSGHSPGSACLYHPSYGGILFSGRHLLPNQQGEPMPLRISKTFHWHRQIRNIQKLLDQFTPESLQFICPGANTGFLRGQHTMDQAYWRLTQLNLNELMQAQPIL